MDPALRRRLDVTREIVTNVCLAIVYGRFAYLFVLDFVEHARVSSLLLLVFESIAALFLLFRRLPVSFSRSPLEWACAVFGTWLALLFRPAETVSDLLVFQVLQLTGVCIALTGLVSLGRSFGLVPANRGVKTGGLYGFVRHPMYLGYLITHLFYVLQNWRMDNVIVFTCMLGFQLLRIVLEERHLSADPEYVSLKERVRYRLIPFVW